MIIFLILKLIIIRKQERMLLDLNPSEIKPIYYNQHWVGYLAREIAK